MSRNYDGWLKIAPGKYQHQRYGIVQRIYSRNWNAQPARRMPIVGLSSMRQAQLVCESEVR